LRLTPSPSRTASRALYQTIRDEDLGRLGGPGAARLQGAVEILDGLVSSPEFAEFRTFPAYRYLD
jgi:malate synthase